ncbi:MAG: multifunctional CCA addition/repair protein [Gammaproteobacteria bacterium]|nr:multifunctional CCA addition/repair protein [Gammaproteobacteria bacterium]
MQIYAVGGAVRDQLLGLPVKDRDWVVVGATAEEMLALNFRPVGKDFPVFLHPQTHEEYALARTERKTAPGYKGFAVHAAADVSLEDDLRRRDLTINAMAQTEAGELIDPFNGAADLHARTLRHVSSAFVEDPVRILRVARFAARFASHGFTVADETYALMAQMVAQGEVDALVAERVWRELSLALAERTPSHFFEVLRKCGALKVLLPEVDRLFGVPQPEKYHPEIDTGVHTLSVVDQAARLSADPQVCFAALLHDLGKGETPPEQWPSHVGHEERGVKLAKGICQRLRVPKEYSQLALLTARYHTHCHRAAELRATTVLDTLQALDAFRRPQRFEQFVLVCHADSRGRTGFEEAAYPQADLFRHALQAANSVSAKALAKQGLKGSEMAQALREQRLLAIKQQRRSL